MPYLQPTGWWVESHMTTYTQIIYQIVFGTSRREKVLTKDNRDTLYKYIWGLLERKNCHPYRINGVEDHLHIITHLHPSVSLAALVKDIKMASSDFIKREHLFPNFTNWQNGYGAFTYSIDAKNNLIEYVKNQEEHHRKLSFEDEYRQLLKEHHIDLNEQFPL